jgi:hypothetical protein
LDGVHALKEQLESKTYEIAGYHEFMVYEPKERLIRACAFKDKVIQHCLCDTVLLPKLRSEFVNHNFAGQIGKGTLFGLDCLKEDMRSYYLENGLAGWILKCDISKFFYNIEHERLKDIVDYYFSDDGIQWLNHMMIDSTNNPGLPLGNQTSQVYALLFLNGLDCFITGELGIKYYGRYMDDFYLIHSSKEYLKECLCDIQQFVESLGLLLNGKTQILPFKNGLNTYVTPDGKVIRKLKNENKRNAKRKYGKMAKLVRDGKLSEKKFKQCYGSWKSHISHGNCTKLTYSMDLYIEKMLGGKN